MLRFHLFLFIFVHAVHSRDENCASEISPFFDCITTNKRNENFWALNRPFSDHSAVDSCFIKGTCGVTPDYDRSLFADFLLPWQQVSKKTWNEFLNTPEQVKKCLRREIRQNIRQNLNICMQNSGINFFPPKGYPEEIELPYCMQETSDNTEVEQMKKGLTEKAALLHELNDCKTSKGLDAVKDVVQCVDGIQSNFTKQKICSIVTSCEKQFLSPLCKPVKDQLVRALCSCAKYRRDSLLQKIQNMYDTGTLQVLKLTPAFVGLDLTGNGPANNDKLKKCYSQTGLKPISLFTATDSPFLSNILRGFRPRPQAHQAILNLVYAQLDLPDLCDSC